MLTRDGDSDTTDTRLSRLGAVSHNHGLRAGKSTNREWLRQMHIPAQMLFSI
jgi:hypothetical protein